MNNGKQKTLEAPVNSDLLREITRRIVAKIKPEKIILFGSHAYGKPNKDSDLDFLIIKNTRLPVSKRYGVISDALFPRMISMDFVVRTPKEIRQRLRSFDPFLEEVLKLGKVLYEKN